MAELAELAAELRQRAVQRIDLESLLHHSKRPGDIAGIDQLLRPFDIAVALLDFDQLRNIVVPRIHRQQLLPLAGRGDGVPVFHAAEEAVDQLVALRRRRLMLFAAPCQQRADAESGRYDCDKILFHTHNQIR